MEPPKPVVTVEAGAPEVPVLKLKDLIEEALGRNPELYAFREKWKALLNRVITDTAPYAQIEKDPLTEGRIVSIVLAPKAEKL